MEVQTITPAIRQDIEVTFREQREFAPQLARSSLRERLRRLEKMDAYLKDPGNLKRLVDAMHRDFRKPEVEVLATETGVVQTQISFVKKNLRRWMQPKKVATPLPMAGTSSYLYYEPKGVCLILAPWNYPLNLALVPLVYAIAAGNAAILKPSEISAHTSAYIKRMMAELYDEREVTVFEGDASVAQALLEQPFNHIFFTGSPKIGKVVMEAAARHLASVTLELGGKSPTVIDESAAVETVAERTAWGKCINTGQTCIAPDYLIVHESVSDAFVEAYGKYVRQFYDPAGQGIRQSPDYPRIISDPHFRRLKRLFDDAVEKGARVAVGGEFEESERYISPTLLTGVDDDMEIMHEEIFGPLLPMLTYRRREEAIEVIRRRPKPLTMYINSRNKENIRYFLEHSSAGGTVINEYMLGYSNPNLPFGGVNNSGIGKSLGHQGFVEFSNERGVIKRNWGTLRFIYPPYNDRTKRLVKNLYKWI